MSGKRRGRGEGSIEELPSGKWRAVLSAGKNGTSKKRRKMSFTANTKREALAWLREKQNEQFKGRLADPGTMTVAVWLAKWLEIKKGKIEPGTWKFYETKVRRHLTPNIGHVLLRDLTKLGVEELHVKLTEQGASAGEQHKVATTLRAALNDAIESDLLTSNPALRVKKPKVTKREMRCLDVAEARRFQWAAQGNRLHAYFVLALDAGMRQGELFALHWPDVDIDNRTVFVRQSLEELDNQYRLKPPKTQKGRRVIQVAPGTIKALVEHRERMKEEERDVKNGPVFVNSDGGWLNKSNFYRRVFQPILKRSGISGLRPNDLRHTSASLLLARGASIKMISERLGHENIEITLKHYVHLLPSMQNQAATIMEELFG